MGLYGMAELFLSAFELRLFNGMYIVSDCLFCSYLFFTKYLPTFYNYSNSNLVYCRGDAKILFTI